MKRRTLLQLASLSALYPAFGFAKSAADAFPEKPVTMVVPFAAGQSGDILARLLGEALGQIWGRPLVVENRGGAGGTIGSIAVARARPDGYTLLLGSSGPTAIAPSLYDNVGYDPNADFTPIVNVAGVAQVLLVPVDSPYQTMQDFIDDAKRQPGRLNYGSGGTGSTAHLTMEYFKSQAGIDIEHVPYKGAGPAYPDLLSGRLNAMFDTTPAAIPYIQSNQLRALAVSTGTRSPSLPDVPTAREAGLEDFELLAWWGIVAPAGLAPALQGKLNQDFSKVLDTPDIRKRLEEMGMSVLGGTPEAFEAFIRDEHARFAEVIRVNDIKVN